MPESTAMSVDAASFDPTSYTIQPVPTDKIQPSRHQARKEFNEESLKTLAESIKIEGLLEPIIVRKGEGDQFELIAGERRFRACRSLGWAAIPARIITTVSEGEAAAKGLVENLQREDLNPMEEAEGFAELNKVDDHWTQEKIAQVCGKDRTYVTKSLALLNLSTEVQDNVRRHTLSRDHGIELARLGDKNQQNNLLKQVLDKSLTAKQTRKLVDEALGGTKAKAKKPPIIDPLADLWTELDIKTQHKGGSKWGFEVDLGKADDLKQAMTEWFLKAAGTLKPGTPALVVLSQSKDSEVPDPTPAQIEKIRTKWAADLKRIGLLTDEDIQKLNGERN